MDGRLAPLVVVFAAAGCGADHPGPDAPCPRAADVDGRRLSQIQVVGSHNSHRRRTYGPLFAHVRSLAACRSEELDPENWDYNPINGGRGVPVRICEQDLPPRPLGAFPRPFG